MKHLYLKSTSGVTIVEMLLVIAIMAILLGLGAANVSGTIGRTALQTSLTTIITNMRDQQLKAMLGDTEGRSSPDYYGIYLEQTRYTLFHGSTYNASDPDNFIIDLDNNIQIENNTFPSSQIVFDRVSGEIVGYNASTDTFTLEDATGGQQKIIEFNQYGSIEAVN